MEQLKRAWGNFINTRAGTYFGDKLAEKDIQEIDQLPEDLLQEILTANTDPQRRQVMRKIKPLNLNQATREYIRDLLGKT